MNNKDTLFIYFIYLLTTQVVCVLSFSTQVFFFNSTHIFFFNSTRILFYRLKYQNLISTRVCSHDICLVFFPSWTNISQILNQIFIAFDVFYNFRFTYYVFNMFFPLVWFFPQRNAILSLVLKGTRTGLLLIGSRPHASAIFWKRRFFPPFSKNTRRQVALGIVFTRPLENTHKNMMEIR